VDLFGFAADKVPELVRDIGGVQRPVIASSRGSSFDIGRVTLADQEKILLQKVRPLLLRATVQDETRARDILGLGKRVNERLRAASSSGRGAALVYVDATEFPGAVEVGGRDTVAGDKVTFSVILFVGDKDLASFQVEGDKEKLDDLAGRLVAEIEKRLALGEHFRPGKEHDVGNNQLVGITQHQRSGSMDSHSIQRPHSAGSPHPARGTRLRHYAVVPRS